MLLISRSQPFLKSHSPSIRALTFSYDLPFSFSRRRPLRVVTRDGLVHEMVLQDVFFDSVAGDGTDELVMQFANHISARLRIAGSGQYDFFISWPRLTPRVSFIYVPLRYSFRRDIHNLKVGTALGVKMNLVYGVSTYLRFELPTTESEGATTNLHITMG